LGESCGIFELAKYCASIQIIGHSRESGNLDFLNELLDSRFRENDGFTLVIAQSLIYSTMSQLVIVA